MHLNNNTGRPGFIRFTIKFMMRRKPGLFIFEKKKKYPDDKLN